MDEVSSYVRLVPAVRLTARPPKRLFRLVFESHDGRALGADSEEKHEPVSDIDTAVADSLKVLDLKRPIREADIRVTRHHVCFGASAIRQPALGLTKKLNFISPNNDRKRRSSGHK